MTNIRKVGLIGLGTLGKPMAKNLVKAGFDLAVYDIRKEPVKELEAAGATPCVSASELAARSEALVSMVLNISQTEEVIFGSQGVMTGVRPGTRLVIGSTIGPGPMRSIARALEPKGVTVIDAALSGGYPSAEKGALTVMIGGDSEALDDVMPVLQAVGSTILRAGAVGDAQAAKLANNLTQAINIIALLEGLALGIAAGVEPGTLKEILRKSSGNSYVLEVWEKLGPRWKKRLARRQREEQVPNLCKDLRLAVDFARELGVPLPVGSLASAIWEGGIATGHDDPRI
jgi:3-hydroxyisobutyrate dehydrogenase-like beta-hydroxyacid dehydrogenase